MPPATSRRRRAVQDRCTAPSSRRSCPCPDRLSHDISPPLVCAPKSPELHSELNVTGVSQQVSGRDSDSFHRTGTRIGTDRIQTVTSFRAVCLNAPIRHHAAPAACSRPVDAVGRPFRHPGRPAPRRDPNWARRPVSWRSCMSRASQAHTPQRSKWRRQLRPPCMRTCPCCRQTRRTRTRNSTVC